MLWTEMKRVKTQPGYKTCTFGLKEKQKAALVIKKKQKKKTEMETRLSSQLTFSSVC